MFGIDLVCHCDQLEAASHFVAQSHRPLLRVGGGLIDNRWDMR